MGPYFGDKSTVKNTLIYGIRPVEELLSLGDEIDRVFIDKDARSDAIQSIKTQLRDRGIIWKSVPREKLDRLTKKNHQGIICFTAPVDYADIEEIVTGIFEIGEDPFIIALDRITDVRNLGAIARTAECAGVHAILVPARDSAPLSDDAVKSSSGALLRIPVARASDFSNALQKLQDSGLRIIGLSEDGAENIWNYDWKGPLAIVIGAEGEGLSSSVMRKCDTLLNIPMQGEIGSLNASVAAGIAMFAALKARMG